MAISQKNVIRRAVPCHSIFRFYCALFLVLSFSPVSANNRAVIGWVEEVIIENDELEITAKIDTGADFSSINADRIKRMVRNGEDWVRVDLSNKSGEEITLEKKVIRYAKIKRKLALPVVRPVINLGVCVGGIYRQIAVNLAKRPNFKYKMLIGRNFLRGNFLVDSSVTHTTQPSCHSEVE